MRLLSMLMTESTGRLSGHWKLPWYWGARKWNKTEKPFKLYHSTWEEYELIAQIIFISNFIKECKFSKKCEIIPHPPLPLFHWGKKSLFCMSKKHISWKKSLFIFFFNLYWKKQLQSSLFSIDYNNNNSSPFNAKMGHNQ